MRKSVDEGVSLMATDQHSGYARPGRQYPHQTVDHERAEYVRGNVHTANPDSFWSLLKRDTIGTYHNVSRPACRCT